MTNERAIELLHRISDSQFDGIHGEERREALEMAVMALEQNLGNNGSICTKTGVNDEDRTTDDLISRKQVLNASHFVACWDGVEHFSLEVVDADFIQKLPSVQPTQTNADSTQINTLDCVSRQWLMECVNEGWIKFDTDKDENRFIHLVRDIAPSAHPERKKGKWIWWYEESFTEHATEYTPHCKCSECGRECAPSVATSSNFCRNCGADMRGENDE